MKRPTPKKLLLVSLTICLLGFFIYYLTQSNKTPSTKSLELAFKNGVEALRQGNETELEKIVHLPEDRPSRDKSAMLESLSHMSSLPALHIKKSHTIGTMGVIAFSSENDDFEMTLFAKWHGDHWKFYIESLTWLAEDYLIQAGLSEQDQKDAIALLQWLRTNTQVGKSGIGAHERLGWYLPYVPENLAIEKFYETPSPSMDHEYIWKIKIDQSEEFEKFKKQLTISPPNINGKNTYSEPPMFASHPDWWRNLDFKKGILKQYSVSLVNDRKGGARAYLFVFLENGDQYLYILAL